MKLNEMIKELMDKHEYKELESGYSIVRGFYEHDVVNMLKELFEIRNEVKE